MFFPHLLSLCSVLDHFSPRGFILYRATHRTTRGFKLDLRPRFFATLPPRPPCPDASSPMDGLPGKTPRSLCLLSSTHFRGRLQTWPCAASHGNPLSLFMPRREPPVSDRLLSQVFSSRSGTFRVIPPTILPLLGFPFLPTYFFGATTGHSSHRSSRLPIYTILFFTILGQITLARNTPPPSPLF